MATCGLEPHGREDSIGTTRSDQARGWSISRRVDQSAPIKVAADEVVAEHSPSHCHLCLAHWNTRLFHWNTRANPSVPDQIVAQRPETHNAHTFSVIGDGRKILEHWNTHFAQSSSGPAGPSSPLRCHRGRVASMSAAALSLHLLKKRRSQCSSVPVRRRPRQIGLETCANTLSSDFSFCILERSPAQRVFQPVPAFQQGGQAGR